MIGSETNLLLFSCPLIKHIKNIRIAKPKTLSVQWPRANGTVLHRSRRAKDILSCYLSLTLRQAASEAAVEFTKVRPHVSIDIGHTCPGSMSFACLVTI